LLQREGYATLVAASAEEAQDVFQIQEPSIDLLITDAILPGISGAELARRLQLRKADLAVLVLSASNGQLDRVVEGFPSLSKPFTTLELTHCVVEVLPRKKPMGREKTARHRRSKSG
jgi:DNA-binding response OmpR family regulator